MFQGIPPLNLNFKGKKGFNGLNVIRCNHNHDDG